LYNTNVPFLALNAKKVTVIQSAKKLLKKQEGSSPLSQKSVRHSIHSLV